ncbi:high-affinity iron transporter [Colletotrichum truncatum]|uniref:High-affinity iron transporter n=1 Tax=Colletotrichum truncatum TaxID=5467 RepID=A0ACC3ZA24_COLTU|nr:high-affinity iron transporter [Colletotrichum truncatum]KAF6795998.1 high-affinity iron transporter [Colletotrichum truncatum]
MTVDVFSVPVFLVVFRESLETVIIVSVLLAFLKQTLDGPNRDLNVYKSLRRQVWLGTGIGFLICLIAAGVLIGVFYKLGRNSWEAHELYYEGAFSILAAVIITIMGAALLRIGKMQEKWRIKLAKAMESPIKTGANRGWLKHFAEKYAMFVLPFITVLREGIEAIVFVAGVSFSAPATAVPLPVVIGLIIGALVGYLLYKGGSTAKLQVFLVISTCLLYLVAAGLFTKAVGDFEQQAWNNVVGGDAAELGNGPGSYDIDKSVWHVNCCSPELNGGGGWGIFNAILGWTNSATYGSVIAYNVYWIFVMAGFFLMRFRETRGHWPLMKQGASQRQDGLVREIRSGNEIQCGGGESDKLKEATATKTATGSS